MPKIQLEIPLEVSEKLKKYAKDDFRSLRNYLVLKLTDLANLGYVTAAPTTLPPIPEKKHYPVGLKPTASSITLEQLQEAGITKIPPLDKTTQSPEEVELKKLKIAYQKDRIRRARIDYFKKKYKEVYGEYPPAAFRAGAMQYILIKYPNDEALDAYIDTLDRLSYRDVTDPEYEFYDYQNDIERFESKLYIPVEQNEIYRTVKEYCLQHDYYLELLRMLEYPTQAFDTYQYYTEINGQPSFLFDILDFSIITKDDVVEAFHRETFPDE